LKFHAIYWPAFLLAADIQPYKRLLVHGWWTKDANKMSKSIGNTIDPAELKKFWGLEPVKFFLLREVTLNTDSDYSDEAMLLRYNNDLGDVLGNLVMRILSPKLNESMLIPQVGPLTEADMVLIKDVETLPGTVDHNIAFGRTRIALSSVWEVLHALNKYLTDQAPWKLKKSDPERLSTVNYVLCECLRIICLCLWPFISQTSEAIMKGLGAPGVFENDKDAMFKFGVLKAGTKMTEVPPLFPRKELKKTE
jgi:methionyl-tRNA synthetase